MKKLLLYSLILAGVFSWFFYLGMRSFLEQFLRGVESGSEVFYSNFEVLIINTTYALDDSPFYLFLLCFIVVFMISFALIEIARFLRRRK